MPGRARSRRSQRKSRREDTLARGPETIETLFAVARHPAETWGSQIRLHTDRGGRLIKRAFARRFKMAFPAHLIIDGKGEFNVMESYFRMFPHEMSTKLSFTYNVPTSVRIPQMTYEKLLDKMIELRNSAPTIDNFVIVVHGLHDAKDFGWGLAMPMTDNTAMKASYEVLKPLVELRDAAASESELENFETKYSYSNPNLNLVKVKYPKGSVTRLVDKMTELQKLQVRIVELRACTLGTNKPGLEIVGQSFGARFVVAPDVHMFYVSINAEQGFNSGPVFDRLLKSLPQARKFANPQNASEKLAVGVRRGGGVSFVTDVLTNTANLKWFTDKLLWSDNRYMTGAAKPAPFFMGGMDLLAGRYALPQEQTYCDHLVEVGPLPGNLI
jgi:hypothetical protein